MRGTSATVVAAELIAAQHGLGFRMQQAQLYYDLFITHDVDEAVYLANRVWHAVYHQPKSEKTSMTRELR